MADPTSSQQNAQLQSSPRTCVFPPVCARRVPQIDDICNRSLASAWTRACRRRRRPSRTRPSQDGRGAKPVGANAFPDAMRPTGTSSLAAGTGQPSSDGRRWRSPTRRRHWIGAPRLARWRPRQQCHSGSCHESAAMRPLPPQHRLPGLLTGLRRGSAPRHFNGPSRCSGRMRTCGR